MGWSLAGNLNHRANSIRDTYPGIVIYSVGDTSHQAKPSDHNPDSRGIVHAIDVMTYSDTTRGNQVLNWCLGDTTDLEYIIYSRKIYERSNGFRSSSYGGSDPHTDHVHISGKHGGTGYSSTTGTGYDTAAEAYRPAGMEEDVSASDVWSWDVDPSGNKYSAGGSLWTVMNRSDYLANNFAPTTTSTLKTVQSDIASIESALANQRAEVDKIRAAVADLSYELTSRVASAAEHGRSLREVRIILLIILVVLLGVAISVGLLPLVGK